MRGRCYLYSFVESQYGIKDSVFQAMWLWRKLILNKWQNLNQAWDIQVFFHAEHFSEKSYYGCIVKDAVPNAENIERASCDEKSLTAD